MISYVGQHIFHKAHAFGEFMYFSYDIFKAIVWGKLRFKNIVHQMVCLGIESLPVVSITILFSGMAFGIQIVKELLRFGAPDLVGGVMALALWRELSPLLTGIVLAGRVGAFITAEIGAMKVNEQIDALMVMGQDPIAYLAAPRLVAILFFGPLLVGFADIIGVIGGLLVALSSNAVSYTSFFTSANVMLGSFDIISGLIKAIVFSIIIGLNATYLGFCVKDGSHDVGAKTTIGVVRNITLIFILNYIISAILFG
jgi:phospholipid/cholesterol/gamma-HCH transport system permease protein